MNNITIVTVLITSLITSGCGLLLGKVMTLNAPTSKYFPNYSTEIGVNSYYSMLEKIDSKVVTDEHGTFFHKKIDDGLFVKCVMLNENMTALKTLLSSSIGLMEPVYLYDSTGRLNLDWHETERRYRYFTDILGLKLLPLYSTKYYHELIIEKFKKDTKSVSSFDDTMRIYKREDTLYNSIYFRLKINLIAKDATYIIANNYTEEYDPYQDGVKFKEETEIYNLLSWKLSSFYQYNIKFIPIDYLKSMVERGWYEHYSGCFVISKEYDIYNANVSFETSAIPYVSGIYSLLKQKADNRDENYRMLSREKYLTALKKKEKYQEIIEKECRTGLKAIGISGFIESKKISN